MTDTTSGPDTTRASSARVYDYLLGGTHNFAADQEVGEQVIALQPLAPLIAKANRAWLGRAVRYLAERGVRQFLDIGSGVPTVGNVHEVAQRAAPDARVLYVDIDPVAVWHSRQILAGNDLADAVQGDLRRPGELLAQLDTPELQSLIDPGIPTALILASVVQFVPDDVAAADAVRALCDRLAPGSYLALSHPTPEAGGSAESAEEGVKAYRERAAEPFRLRRPEEIHPFLSGFTLVEPGLVWVPEWRPDPAEPTSFEDPSQSGIVAGVAHKVR
ncbi:SAM-dependent methyltransferase [Phytohabitans rumicis]|nr:SAM-dependent methyltransferase [Phytohabitans rumicis]